MTCLSVFVQISKKYTHYGAIVLFMYFGLRMLYDVAFGGEAVRFPGPSPDSMIYGSS